VQRHSYADFTIDYRPVGSNWFVLSGDGGGKTFYEKVMFSCDGRLINSFALIYPTTDKRRFDAVVEGIQATFRPEEIARVCQDALLATERRSLADRAPPLPIASRGSAGTTSLSFFAALRRHTIGAW
jgi:hypothetical protein